MVIYHHSMVIPSFCVMKEHNLGNYCRMALNYHGIHVTNVIKHNLNLNERNILHLFNPGKSRVKIAVVIYHGVFITLAPGFNIIFLSPNLQAIILECPWITTPLGLAGHFRVLPCRLTSWHCPNTLVKAVKTSGLY